MIPKTDFLLICAGAITPKGSINSGNFEKNFTVRWVKL